MVVKDILETIYKLQPIQLNIPSFKDMNSEEVIYDIKTESYDSKDNIPSKYFNMPISIMQINDNVISLFLDANALFLDVDTLAKILSNELVLHFTGNTSYKEKDRENDKSNTWNSSKKS